MSRAGNRPIKLEEGVTADINSNDVTLKMGSFEKRIKLLKGIKVNEKDNNLLVSRSNDSKEQRSYHGLVARLLKASIEDLTKGTKKDLAFTGTGYRAKVESDKLILTMGYSHDVELTIPKRLTVTIKKNDILIEGNDRAEVGEFAAKVREVRPPEVYKGKGIRYKDEQIKRKAGKAAQSGKE